MPADDYLNIARQIEREISSEWDNHGVFKTPLPGSPDFDASKEKFSVLDFFPFPSGYGLHIGHPLGYIATDVVARKKRMENFNVLYSMGFDSFGLPTEQYAIETGTHPIATTEKNIANMRRQLHELGLSHDPDRVFTTTDPDYYKWTQSIFLQMYNSYYDPQDEWEAGPGYFIKGRAKDISQLQRELEAGSWLLSADNIPVPASLAKSGARRFSSDTDDMAAALNKARLAFTDKVEVLWCPRLGTVLSKEEVTPDGVSERGGHPVIRTPLTQWVLRITAYADRLVDDLDFVEWPASTKEMQKNWIGRSQGDRIHFPVAGAAETSLPAFTTRAETLSGVTALVVSPKHELAVNYRPETEEQASLYALLKERSETLKRRDSDLSFEKEGLFLGIYVQNPLTGEEIPVFTSDYVSSDYGSGAVMVVPAHDQRDFDFARRMGLSSRAVFIPPAQWLAENKPDDLGTDSAEILEQVYLQNPLDFKTAYTEKNFDAWIDPQIEGLSLNGLTPDQAVSSWLVKNNAGEPETNYRIHDWIFSRQRYWGEPFPIVHDVNTGETFPLHEEELPVVLPDISNYAPNISDDANATEIEVPLSRAKEWKSVRGYVLDDGKARLAGADQAGKAAEYNGKTYAIREFERELNTMPNWAGSSWYYLRYADPDNKDAMIDPDIEKYWAGSGQQKGWVDLYVGGAEHAVLHLLYGRFWHKFLQDRGLTSTAEPFHKLYNQGMITGEAYRNSAGSYVDIHDVKVSGSGADRMAINEITGEKLSIEMGKIGKRYKNGLPPEELIEEYSADTFRLFELYLGPLDQSKPWNTEQIIGMQRFCRRVWNLQDRVSFDESARSEDFSRSVNEAVASVSRNIDSLRLNVAIADIIKLTNEMTQMDKIHADQFHVFLKLLSPFAPFMTDKIHKELYPLEHNLHHTLMKTKWPEYDEALEVEKDYEIPVTINGKKIGVISAPASRTDEELMDILQNDADLKDSFERAMTGRELKKFVIPRKPHPVIINVVASEKNLT